MGNSVSESKASKLIDKNEKLFSRADRPGMITYAKRLYTLAKFRIVQVLFYAPRC
jgi:hypothetical protein